jgi:hypothetical protein
MTAQQNIRGEKPNPIVRILPSLTDVAFVLPIIFLFWKLGGATRMLEGDTGWHIRTGEWILQNGRVPQIDIFSFTKPGEPWFAWEWLWDVTFAVIHQHLGLAGVVFASLVVLCVTSMLLYRLVLGSCANPFIAFAVTWVAVAASSIHWWARPHLFTFLFVVLFLHVLERAKEGAGRWLWLLPPMSLLWVNIHGGFLVGLMLAGGYAAGDLLSGLFTEDKTKARTLMARSRRYGFALAGCFAATFANPYFYRLHVHVYLTLTDPESPLYRFVGEWQPLSLRGPLAWYAEPMIILSVAASIWHLANRRFVYPLLLLSFLHSAFFAARNLPIFMLVAAAPVAAVLEEMLGRVLASQVPSRIRQAVTSFNEAAADFASVDSHWRLHLASIVPFCLLTAAFFQSQPAKSLTAEYDVERYPVKAVDELGNLLAGAVFAEDEWGDYLIYRLYPHGRVFVDGRFDFYGGKFTERYLDVMNAKYDWESSLESYRIDTMLLSAKSPLAATLKEARRWRVVYDDGVAIVFRLREKSAIAAESTEVDGRQLPRDTSAGHDARVSRNLKPLSQGDLTE